MNKIHAAVIKYSREKEAEAAAILIINDFDAYRQMRLKSCRSRGANGYKHKRKHQQSQPH
jgi:hypothetical protein